jgi:carbonic anhydrase/acetyltransferase-like protein (isoleucine patch superfamily)
MIIKKNEKPLRIIGIPQSTITQEGAYFITGQDKFKGDFAVITPDDFLALEDKTQFQYLCMFTLDTVKRLEVIDLLDAENLDCFSYVHRSVVLYKDFEELTYDEAVNIIGKGTVISPFSSILLNSKINDHCLIETYCLLSHYSELKRNVILHSGVMIAGKTTIGENSVFNFKAAALNGLTICNNVEVGGASTITKNLDQPGRYIGSVARYVGERLPFNE